MDTIADDPGKQPVIIQARSPLSPGSRAFSCDMALNRWVTPDTPKSGRMLYFGGGRLAVTGRDTQSSADQFVDHGRRHAFRGQRHNRAAAGPETLDRGEIAPIGHAYLGFRMNALARPVKRRPFEMEAQHTGNLQASLSDSSQLLDHLRCDR